MRHEIAGEGQGDPERLIRLRLLPVSGRGRVAARGNRGPVEEARCSGDDIPRTATFGQPGEPGIKETLGPEMTVVGRGARVEGTLVSAESIRIDGQVKGKIAARCDVILSSNSDVEADIRAQNVVSGGTLKGTITARTRTEVAQGGRVEGKIRSKELVVSEGARSPARRTSTSRTPQARQTGLRFRRRDADEL